MNRRVQKNYKESRVVAAKERPFLLDKLRRIVQLHYELRHECELSLTELAIKGGEGTADNFNYFKQLSAQTITSDNFGSTPRLWALLSHFDSMDVSFGKAILVTEDLDDDAFESFLAYHKDDLRTAINGYKSYDPGELEATCVTLREEIRARQAKIIDADILSPEYEELQKEINSRRGSLKVLTDKKKKN